MKFKIITDSSADLIELDAIPFAGVPLKIITDEREYVDNASLNVSGMLTDLKKYKGKSHSSCPNPEDYIAAFENADNIFCVTITSGLSGSYNSACAAAKAYIEEHPERNVHVIDSLSTGPENALLIEKLRELISEGLEFEEIKEKISEYHTHTRLIFALESMHNLARNGRVSPIVAKVAGILGIRVIGRASEQGTLEITNKSRGAQNAMADIIKNMADEGYTGGRIKIHHAENEAAANTLRDKLLEKYPNVKIDIAKTRGLCSFYAECGGLLIGFEV